MELTVKRLKKIISLMDNEVMLATLNHVNNEFHSFAYVRNLFLLERKSGRRYLVILYLESQDEWRQERFRTIRLTVENLKLILDDHDENAIIAIMPWGENNFHAFDYIKRLLLLQNENGDKYLTINDMGTHFPDKTQHRSLQYLGGIELNIV